MKIRADITWSGCTTADQSYSRTHQWCFDGGGVISASASPDIVPPPGADPALVDPEEAIVASLASCHMLFYLSLAANAGFVVGNYADAPEGVMEPDANNRQSITRITLRPRAGFVGPAPDAQTDEALHARAHDKCFIANSLRAEVVIEPAVVTM